MCHAVTVIPDHRTPPVTTIAQNRPWSYLQAAVRRKAPIVTRTAQARRTLRGILGFGSGLYLYSTSHLHGYGTVPMYHFPGGSIAHMIKASPSLRLRRLNPSLQTRVE